MQNSVDNELFRQLKFSTEDLMLSVSQCLQRISQMNPSIAKDKMADLDTILNHLKTSLSATNYTNCEAIDKGFHMYKSMINKL